MAEIFRVEFGFKDIWTLEEKKSTPFDVRWSGSTWVKWFVTGDNAVCICIYCTCICICVWFYILKTWCSGGSGSGSEVFEWNGLSLETIQFVHSCIYICIHIYVFVFDFVFVWKHDVLGVVVVVRKCLREMGRDWRQSSRQSTGEVSEQFRGKKHSQKEKGKTIKRFEVRCFLSSLISCFWVLGG